MNIEYFYTYMMLSKMWILKHSQTHHVLNFYENKMLFCFWIRKI